MSQRELRTVIVAAFVSGMVFATMLRLIFN